MQPEWMDAFLSHYPNLPKSTFFLHKDTGDWFSTHHEINEHPTIENLSEYSLLNNVGHPIRGKGIRSHSCVSSHLLSINWAQTGIRYQSQETRWCKSYESPERTAWGIFELPISYMDNQDFWMQTNWPGKHEKFSQKVIDIAINSKEIFLFDFHPLHIALNTSSADDYANKKPKIFQDRKNPWKNSNSGPGVRHFFERLLNSISNSNSKTSSCEELFESI